MKVYYFTNSEYGLQNIEKSRLKISDFKNVNDPFELSAFEVSNKSVRAIIQELKDNLSDKYGLLCFSESRYDPVQWGHYGDNHKGLCLGFDVPESTLKKVKYVANRINAKNIKNPDVMFSILSTKFKHWSYEQEHRKIINLSELKLENGLFFEAFSENLILKEIYIGCQSQLNHDDVLNSLKKSSSTGKVRIFYTRPAFKDFRIVQDQSKKVHHT